MNNLREAVTTIGAYVIGYSIVLGGCTALIYLMGLLDKIIR